jgi:DNA-binding MarR family transcriptional regulator
MSETIPATALSRAAYYGLNARQLLLLRAIAARPGLSVKDYADELNAPKPHVTRTADGYPSLIRRERDLRDGRCVRLFITPAARRLLTGEG